MKKSDLFFNAIRLPVDFGMLLTAGITTYLLRTKIISAFRPVYFTFDLSLLHYFYLVIFVSGLFLSVYAVSGLYSMKVRITPGQEFLKILIASSAGILAVIIFVFLRQELFNSRFLVLGGWFWAIIFVFLGRLIIRQAQRYIMTKYNFGIHKVMIIGQDSLSSRIIGALDQDRSYGYQIVKHLLNPVADEVKLAVGNPGIDEVILTNPHYPAQSIVELVDFCHENHIIFKFIPNIYETLTTHFDIEAVDNIPLIELKRTKLDGWGKVIKRTLDIIFSSIALVILSPLMLICAFAVKWETAGPVFAKLKRVSGNKEFYLYKFRSMVENAQELKTYLAVFNERNDGPLFKMKNDPRVTRVGRFLRRYRLDELPQFLNILFGDISLVGPRPHQPDEIAQYAKNHKKVLAIQAGATGMAQISGSSDLPFDHEVELDTFYIENWSLGMDLKIVFKTVFKVLKDHSAV